MQQLSNPKQRVVDSLCCFWCGLSEVSVGMISCEMCSTDLTRYGGGALIKDPKTKASLHALHSYSSKRLNSYLQFLMAQVKYNNSITYPIFKWRRSKLTLGFDSKLFKTHFQKNVSKRKLQLSGPYESKKA